MSTSTSTNKPATSMAELMKKASSKITTFKKGEIVTGTVKKLTPSEILLDINGKSDALVLEFDKKNLANLLSLLHVGDTVTASVISSESEEGFPVVSLRRMLDELLYKNLGSQLSKGQLFTVHVLEATRGGYFAETTSGIKGFLPNSQVMSEGNIANSDVEVTIIELDREKRRVIFSEKAKHYVTDLSQLAAFAKENTIVTAKVISPTNHGLYVAIEQKNGLPIEGFIHISEVSYERIADLKSMYEKGDSVKAHVVEVDAENRRLTLSLKRLEKDAFAKVKEQYPLETALKGKIVDIKSKGITVQFENDVKGLIQASKVPSDSTYKVGEEIEVEVVGYEDRSRLLLLSPVMKTKFVGYR